MFPVDSLIKVAEILFEKLKDWTKSRHEKVDRTYHAVVEDSFRELEVIHKDYLTKLSRYREYLVTRALNPEELIRWLENAGLEYRSDRDKLWTLIDEVSYFKVPERPRTSAEEFYRALYDYIRSVSVVYFSTILYKSGTTAFRRHESELQDILGEIGGIEQHRPLTTRRLRSDFYNHPRIALITKELKTFCNEELPASWKFVCKCHRAVRAAAKFPGSDKAKSE